MRLLVVTHGPLATAMKESARMFFGDMVDEIGTLELYPTDSPEGLLESITNYIQIYEEEVLILVDIQSGSPFNMAAIAIDALCHQYRIECYTGVNMPILMEVLGMKGSMSLDELVDHIETIAPSTIVNLRKSLDI